MKSFTSTLVFTFIVLAIGGFAYYEFESSKEDEVIKSKAERLLPDWSLDVVDEFKIVTEKKALHLKKEEGLWQIIAPIKDEADLGSVNGLISSILSDKVKKLEVKGSVNWNQYGLGNMKNFVELISSKMKTKKIHVSSKKTYDGQFYLRFSDENNVLLASSSWGSWLNRKANEIRNKKIYKSNSEIIKIKISKNIVLIKKDNKWFLEKDDKFIVNEDKMSKLLSSVKNFRAIDVVAEKRTESTLKSYKLKKVAGQLHVFQRDIDEPFVFNVGQASNEDNEVYLFTNKKPFIYKTYKSVTEKWLLSKTDLKQEKEKTKDKTVKDDSLKHNQIMNIPDINVLGSSKEK